MKYFASSWLPLKSKVPIVHLPQVFWREKKNYVAQFCFLLGGHCPWPWRTPRSSCQCITSHVQIKHGDPMLLIIFVLTVFISDSTRLKNKPAVYFKNISRNLTHKALIEETCEFHVSLCAVSLHKTLPLPSGFSLFLTNIVERSRTIYYTDSEQMCSHKYYGFI